MDSSDTLSEDGLQDQQNLPQASVPELNQKSQAGNQDRLQQQVHTLQAAASGGSPGSIHTSTSVPGQLAAARQTPNPLLPQLQLQGPASATQD